MSMRQLKISKSITNREAESLEKYLQEIARIKLLTVEQEAHLAAQIRQGDQRALNALVSANLRFVVSVAKQYQNQGLGLCDLINEGNLGLMHAARRFDETKGFKFISYAVWWIRQSILQALAEKGRIVKLPLSRVGVNNRILKYIQQTEQCLERPPTQHEIAEELNISEDEVRYTLQGHSRHVSMDAPVHDDDNGNLGDMLEDINIGRADKQLDYQEGLRIELERGLSALTPKQKQVLCSYFGLGCDSPRSLEDIGEEYQLTRERVRQIKDKALSKLQMNGRCQQLRQYLG